MPEITQAQLDVLTRNSKLLESLTGDKDVGIATQKKLQQIDPSLRFPNLEISETVTAPLRAELNDTKAALKRIEDERKAEREAAANAAAESKVRDSISRAQAKHKLSQEATDNLLKFMTDKGIADAEIAAPAFLETLPKPPAPIAPSAYTPQYAQLFGTGDNMGSDENIASLHRDPVKWFDQEVGRIMAEPTE